MKNFLLILFVLKLIIGKKYEFEPIKENIPKSASLFYSGNSYKIYEYIPLLSQI